MCDFVCSILKTLQIFLQCGQKGQKNGRLSNRKLYPLLVQYMCTQPWIVVHGFVPCPDGP